MNKRIIIFVLGMLLLCTNSFAEMNETNADSILVQYAKEDRNKVMELGYNIYSIETFKQATKALERVDTLGRDKVLVDKGDSYNVIVPGTGKLSISPVEYNSYGGGDYYMNRTKNNIDYGRVYWYRSWTNNNAAFNPLRPAASRSRR